MYRVPRQVPVYLYRRRDGRTPEFLLLRRAATSEEWIFWQGVSGAPEGDESDVDAALREVREETGFDVSATLRPVGIRFELRWQEHDPERWALIYAPGVDVVPEEVFTAEVSTDDEPTLAPDEHDAYLWATIDDALELLKYENNKQALLAAHKHLERFAKPC